MSPSLYRIVVPLIRRNGQPMFSRRSCWSTLTLQLRMAAYVRSSTQAQGTAGTCARSTILGTLLISPPRYRIRRFLRSERPSAFQQWGQYPRTRKTTVAKPPRDAVRCSRNPERNGPGAVSQASSRWQPLWEALTQLKSMDWRQFPSFPLLGCRKPGNCHCGASSILVLLIWVIRW